MDSELVINILHGELPQDTIDSDDSCLSAKYKQQKAYTSDSDLNFEYSNSTKKSVSKAGKTKMGMTG